MVLPGAIAMLGAGGVLAAGALLVLTEPGGADQAAAVAPAAPSAPRQTQDLQVADPSDEQSTGVRVLSGEQLSKKKPPKIVRSEEYVEIYNNTGIVGLAADSASRAQGVGWNVVAVDNWYGTIVDTTVYYPSGMRRQANLLATDLGIDRVVPAVDPMSGDRLTVILTG
ncbi:LytR C-terminal domain-containing protein [Nocardioidaceae bacterium]|nr:LytR C-terminal domain-containing protein [Nocardioidaceae bacterium]